MEDLEMEVDEVEAKVAELMEIGDEYSDPKYDYDDEPNKMELSNKVEMWRRWPVVWMKIGCQEICPGSQ